MHFGKFSFGTLEIDGKTYEEDVIIDRGKVHQRKKTPSRKYRDEFGHTPLSIEEIIPWKCHRLVIGTGTSGLMPVMQAVIIEAQRRQVELVILPTGDAIQLLENGPTANAVLHITC